MPQRCCNFPPPTIAEMRDISQKNNLGKLSGLPAFGDGSFRIQLPSKFSYCGMNPMLKFGWLAFLFLSLNVSAQQKRVIQAEDFLAMLSGPKADTLRLDNIKIVRNENIDLHLLPGSMAGLPIFESQLKNLDTLHIYKMLDLRSVELDWDFAFHRIRFHHHVWLENCDNTGITFSHCRFDSSLYITSQASTSTVSLTQSHVYGNMDLKGIGSFGAFSSSFFDRNTLEGNIHTIDIKNCEFEIRNPGEISFGQPSSLYMRGLDVGKKVSLEMFGTRFKGTGKENGLDLFGITFSYFNLQHCHFQVPLFLYLASFDRVIIENVRFDKPVDMREISLPVTTTNLPFAQLSQKIGVIGTFISTYKIGERLYQAVNEEEMKNQSNYNELIAVYSKLLSTYKYRGDQESYNACYVEMKDIAARKARFDYKQNPSLEGFFEWRLAQFLKTFCDYGTSPVKSLLFSFYVILAFAGLYFLFPSEDDNVSKRSLSRFISSAVDYFKTDKQLLDFQVEKQEAELQIMKQLGEKLEQAKQGTPGILLWIGRPFYAWVSVYHRFMIWFYNRTDLVKGQWSKLSGGRRLWLGILVTGYFLLFVLSGLLVRVLNALALSLNVFVTLGYGEISARGAMRYFAVLEGLLGWFLLSIFSVSLIGQVLQ